ncbi:hypothetical protein ACN47E_000458 [Coniothyrium glycines]
MSSIIARSAFRAAPRIQQRAPALRRWASAASEGDREAGKHALKTGAKRDPELYVLFAITSGVFALAGWHFSRSPTSGSSERIVAKADHSEPWKETGGTGPYQYHPDGDTSIKKDAPSALNVVVIPNVTLPKELHDTYNKWGKDGY